MNYANKYDISYTSYMSILCDIIVRDSSTVVQAD